MASLKPVLYLTSEIHNRDWDTRLLMADFATAKGLSVVVGQQWSPHENFAILPLGLFMGKTMNQIQVNIMTSYRRKGHLVVAMDEEAFGMAPDQKFSGWIPENVHDCCDAFFANSPMHAEVLGEMRPVLKKKITALGNPRMDLLSARGQARYQREAEEIREKVGRFVLFNSNMAQGNSLFDTKQYYMDAQIQAGTLKPDDAESVAIFEGQFEFERANNDIFISVLRWCAENLPKHAIVIRPHPAENPEYWEKFAASDPRITIAANTPHIPWMMASELVVHTNSTTGMEAAIMGKATANLMPQKEGLWMNLYVSSRVNPTFYEWQEATAAIEEFLEHGQGALAANPACESALQRYFPEREKYMVCERMVAYMAALLKKGGVDRRPFNFFNAVVGKYQLYQREEFKIRKFQKTPNQAMADFQSLRRVSKLKHRIQMTQLDDSLFLLSP